MPCPSPPPIIGIDYGTTYTGVSFCWYRAQLDSCFSEVREISCWPGRNTALQSSGILREFQKVVKNSSSFEKEELANPAVAPLERVPLYCDREGLTGWGHHVEPDRPRTWTQLLLSHSQHPPNKLNSEQIAKRFLQALCENICYTSRSEIEVCLMKDLGPVWPIHYREAERSSQILPAMLDSCLQKWAKQRPDEENDEDIHHGTQYHRSSLHFCSALGFKGLGEVYLQMGADPNVLAYPDGQSAVHLAAAGGHTGMMELLFDRDADIEKRTLLTGRTALQLAAYRGHEEAVQLLLEEGADMYVKDKFGHTALALAATNGHKTVANLLRAFDGGELAFLGGWAREGASMDDGDNFIGLQPNHQDSFEVHTPESVSLPLTCPFGKECTSRSPPVNLPVGSLRHIHTERRAQGTMSNDGDEQRRRRRLWSCCKCGDGPKFCQCDDQTRCFDCGGRARSNEVEEDWIAVDH